MKGSYAATVTDGVDIFSGELQNILPLLNVQGRGEASYSVSLPLRNQRWQSVRTGQTEIPNPYHVVGHYQAKLGWTNASGIGGEARLSSFTRGGLGDGGYGETGTIKVQTNRLGSISFDPMVATTIRFSSNDGSVISFRDATDGQPLDAEARGCRNSYIWPNPPPIPQACSRGRVFHSINGENATFVADQDIYDLLVYDTLGYEISNARSATGTLFLSNGTKIVFENVLFTNQNFPEVASNVPMMTKVIDRNGNYLSFEYNTFANVLPGYTLLKTIRDSLNREVTFAYGDYTQPTYFDEIIYKGFGVH